jgi:hypothetical protein
MKAGDKVKVLESPYTMFEVGSIHTVSYFDDRPYGVYLVDPFYQDSDEENSAQWPFSLDEVEVVV